MFAFEAKDLLTAVTVIFGWYVVHKASEGRDNKKLLLELRRDSRKERRELARDSLKLLRELEDQAVKFHTATSYSATSAEGTFRTMDRFGREFLMLAPAEHPLLFAKLRQAVTVDNFECDGFDQQELNSRLLMTLRSAVTDIERVLLPMSRLFEPPATIGEI